MTSTTQEKATVTAITKPRTSRASRSAAQAKAPANVKRTTVKSNTKPKAAPKPAAAKSAKAAPKGPSDRDMRQVVSQMILDMAGDLVKSWRPSDHNGISREVALDAARQTMGYVSHSLTWPSALGARYDANGKALVGRPVSAKKS